jgi:hypothetical protein
MQLERLLQLRVRAVRVREEERLGRAQADTRQLLLLEEMRARAVQVPLRMEEV